MKKIITIFLCMFTMFTFTSVVKAETVRDLKNKLDKLSNEAKVKKETITRTDSEINQTNGRINQIHSDMDFISSEIVRLQEEIVTLNEDIEKKDQQIKELIKAYQTTTEGSFYIEYIFGAETIEDFIYRFSITEQIAKYNDDLIDQMNQKIEDNKTKNIEMEEKTIQLEEQQENLKGQLNYLGGEKKVLEEQKQTIEEEIKSARDVIKMYESAGCQLDDDINTCANKLLPPGTAFYRPISIGYITSEFGNRINPITGINEEFHSGIDMSNSYGINTKIYSVANGEVAKIFFSNCGGNQVFIHHKINGKTYTSAYLHLSSVHVKEGTHVTKDTVIGMMGGNNPRIDYCSTGAHLHLSIYTGLKYVSNWSSAGSNPKLLGPREVINFPRGKSWNDRVTKY